MAKEDQLVRVGFSSVGAKILDLMDGFEENISDDITRRVKLWCHHADFQPTSGLRRPQFCKQPIMNNRCRALMRHHTVPHLLAWSSVLGAVNWICSEQSWVILDKSWGMIFLFLYNRVDWNYCSNNFMVDRNSKCCPHLTTFWAFCAS